MNAARPSEFESDPNTLLKRLADAVGACSRDGDIEGLIRVRTEARTIAEASEGRMRRRADRVAQRATSSIEGLRRQGAETEEERVAREVRAVRESRWAASEARERLLARLTRLLELLFGVGTSPPESVEVLRPLATVAADGSLRVAVPNVFSSHPHLLEDGYERSRAIVAGVNMDALRRERQEIERRLKSLAVALMEAGTEVRGLSTDAVPLVAFAILTRTVPVPADLAASPAASEKSNDLLLRIADDVSAMPVEDRLEFIGLFRLAVIIGEGEGYAQNLGLTNLSFS